MSEGGGSTKHAKLSTRAKLRRYISERLDEIERKRCVHVSVERSREIKDEVSALFMGVCDEETEIKKPSVIDIDEYNVDE